jgi:60 kDa SS-A/Ro ribonucleoprotein
MANKNVFKSAGSKKVVTVKNRAGGSAVALNAKETLAKYVVTCTFNDTYYASGKEHLDELKDVISKIDDNEFIAKAAIYSRKTAGMKDMPAYLLNVLYDRDRELFAKVFDQVIDSGRMLRTFVQLARSDAFGRNLSIRAMRRSFQNWFDGKSSGWLFRNSLGNDPSFADIIKMTHVKGNKNQDLFSYFLGKKYNVDNLPEDLKLYLAWQKDRSLDLPEVNFRLLDSYKLSTNEWAKVMRSCSWNTLRMNLATFTRQEVFKSRDNLKYACEKLQSEMPKNVFPYEVFAAYKMNEDNLMLANALNEVMEKSVENLPEIKGKTLIAIDVSGSMSSKLSDKSSVRCVDVAAMFGACVSRKCENSRVVTFDTDIRSDTTNPKDSILTLAKKLSASGGGTSISSVLDYIEVKNIKVDNVIIISDNESWADRSSWQGSTFADKWNKMTTKGMKLISIDLVPNAYTNAPTSRKNNLCVGGFNDSVWGVIKNFLENSENFTCQIDKTVL